MLFHGVISDLQFRHGARRASSAIRRLAVLESSDPMSLHSILISAGAPLGLHLHDSFGQLALFHSAPKLAPPRARLVLNPCTSPARPQVELNRVRQKSSPQHSSLFFLQYQQQQTLTSGTDTRSKAIATPECSVVHTLVLHFR